MREKESDPDRADEDGRVRIAIPPDKRCDLRRDLISTTPNLSR